MSTPDTLWYKFAEDTTLPAYFEEQQRGILVSIFNPHDPQSHWSKALDLLRLKTIPPDGAIISWVNGVPYMHWNYMTDIVTGGSVKLIRETDNGFTMKARYSMFRLLKLLQTHWRISGFLNTGLRQDTPQNDDARIVESLALGICLLAMRQRLPMMDEATLAKHLQSPDGLSSAQQKTVQHMNAIQERRTEISASWQTYFPDDGGNTDTQHAPDFFWNTPDNMPEGKTAEAMKDQSSWKGIGVSGGNVTGTALFVRSLKHMPEIIKGDAPVILVFPNAQPDTITVFEHADAVLYGTGGVMAHACVIAREQNISCVTALGINFIDTMETKTCNQEKIWLNVDAQTGKVEIIEE